MWIVKPKRQLQPGADEALLAAWQWRQQLARCDEISTVSRDGLATALAQARHLGWTYAEIGALWHVTTQRVQQMGNPPKKKESKP